LIKNGWTGKKKVFVVSPFNNINNNNKKKPFRLNDLIITYGRVKIKLLTFGLAHNAVEKVTRTRHEII